MDYNLDLPTVLDLIRGPRHNPAQHQQHEPTQDPVAQPTPRPSVPCSILTSTLFLVFARQRTTSTKLHLLDPPHGEGGKVALMAPTYISHLRRGEAGGYNTCLLLLPRRSPL
jgi:hypothetical protein